MARPIRHLRWYIGGLLFLSTVINYIDRQTLSVLAPYLKTEYSGPTPISRWCSSRSASRTRSGRRSPGGHRPARHADGPEPRGIVVLGGGDGDVAGLGLRSFGAFRFALGLGEAGNWPGATKAVSEWFPRRESRVGGGAVRQRVVHRRRARAVHRAGGLPRVRQLAAGVHRSPALLGFCWLVAVPRALPTARGSPAALGRGARLHPDGSARRRDRPIARDAALPYRRCCGCRRHGATSSRKSSPIRCGSSSRTGSRSIWSPRDSSSRTACMGFWVPFLAADLGNFFGGGVSS